MPKQTGMNKFLSLSILGLLAIACTSCAFSESDLDTASNAATSALDSVGSAYIASIEQAKMEVMTLYVGELMALSFEGDIQGSTGVASWQGTIDDTSNLQMDYTITFTDYAADPGAIEISGEVAIAVSQTNIDCSATWNISDIELIDPLNLDQFFLSSRGSGLILGGSDCDIMTLSGRVDISGDASGTNCIVTGTTSNPDVNC